MTGATAGARVLTLDFRRIAQCERRNPRIRPGRPGARRRETYRDMLIEKPRTRRRMLSSAQIRHRRTLQCFTAFALGHERIASCPIELARSWVCAPALRRCWSLGIGTTLRLCGRCGGLILPIAQVELRFSARTTAATWQGSRHKQRGHTHPPHPNIFHFRKRLKQPGRAR